MTCRNARMQAHRQEQQQQLQKLQQQKLPGGQPVMKKLSALDPKTPSGSCSMESQDSGVFCDNPDRDLSLDDPTGSPCVLPSSGRQPSFASCYTRRRQFKQNQQSQISISSPDEIGIGSCPQQPERRSIGVNTGPVVYDSGYENLVIGQFMSLSAGAGGWLLNSPSSQQASSEAGRTSNAMHLDFLPSPRDISYCSPQSLSSPTTKDFPQDKYLYRQNTFDSSPLLSPLADSSQDTLDSILAATSADLFGSTLLTSADLLSPSLTDQLSPLSSTFPEKPSSSSSREPWSKYSVLPPLGLAEQHPDPNMAPSVQTLPAFVPGLFPESSTCSSSFTSPRNSTRSSYSCRGGSKKRALSNSPLSIEGIDFNSLIRMSPTSLAPFPFCATESHPSSGSCVYEKQGCYGHLSARNSSSGSTGSSVTRLSLSSTGNVHSTTKDCETIGDVDSQMMTYQAMQLLEAANIPVQDTFVLENHAVLPQDTLHALEEDLLYKAGLCGRSVAVPAEADGPSSVQGQIQGPEALSVPVVPARPPPSYNQHMARKFLLQKKNSSDSSQPSNYSSFDSSEGDRACESEESPQPLILTAGRCQWTDCGQPFSGQEELVRHLERAHVDQRKGDEFTCFWQGCTRKLRPFNARYKLLIHMRVHSGEKPNRCTFEGCPKAFSRLENLKIHLRSHTGERPYACQHPSCNKAFSNSSDRAKHQRTHQDTKPYACNIPGCNKRYTDPSSLRKHVKNHAGTKQELSKKRPRCGLSQEPIGSVGVDAEMSLSDCLTVKSLRPLCVGSLLSTTTSELTSSPLHAAGSVRSPPEPCMDSGLGRSPPPLLTTSRNTNADNFIGLCYPCSSLQQPSPMSHDVGSPGLAEIFESDESVLECLPFLPAISSPASGGLQHTLQTARGLTTDTDLRPSEPLPPIHVKKSSQLLSSLGKSGTPKGFPSFQDTFPKCAASFQSLSNT